MSTSTVQVDAIGGVIGPGRLEVSSEQQRSLAIFDAQAKAIGVVGTSNSRDGGWIARIRTSPLRVIRHRPRGSIRRESLQLLENRSKMGTGVRGYLNGSDQLSWNERLVRPRWRCSDRYLHAIERSRQSSRSLHAKGHPQYSESFDRYLPFSLHRIARSNHRGTEESRPIHGPRSQRLRSG